MTSRWAFALNRTFRPSFEKRGSHFLTLVVSKYCFTHVVLKDLERFVEKAEVNLLQASTLIDYKFSLDFVTFAIP